MNTNRKVVITGLGAVTALGHNVPTLWHNLLAGQSGVVRIDHFDTGNCPVKIGAPVLNFDKDSLETSQEVRRMSRSTQFAMGAAIEAWKDSGLSRSDLDPSRGGAVIGTGQGGFPIVYEFGQDSEKAPGKRPHPLSIPKSMPNAVAGHIALEYGLFGPSFVTSSACASSNHSIATAYRLIQAGDADVLFSGGTEESCHICSLMGFHALQALSMRNEEPGRASRPFDKHRNGFVIGEGAGILLLEEKNHALRRGARIYAELKGIGMSSDAHHIVAPHPEGIGGARAIQLALRDAGVSPSDVQYINAHGTSTNLNDEAETKAIHTVFGEFAGKIPVSATKSMTGHALGAGGAIELVATALSVSHQKIHPTLNYEEPDPKCDLDYVPGEAREIFIKHAISNSFGFGGQNAVVVLGADDGKAAA